MALAECPEPSLALQGPGPRPSRRSPPSRGAAWLQHVSPPSSPGRGWVSPLCPPWCVLAWDTVGAWERVGDLKTPCIQGLGQRHSLGTVVHLEQEGTLTSLHPVELQVRGQRAGTRVSIQWPGRGMTGAPKLTPPLGTLCLPYTENAAFLSRPRPGAAFLSPPPHDFNTLTSARLCVLCIPQGLRRKEQVFSATKDKH